MYDINGIPLRSELIERLRRANRIAIPWVAVQFVIAFVLAANIRWAQVWEDPLIAVIAILIVVGENVMNILRLLVRSKREIGDLKEQTKFGEFDKYRLRYLVDDTLDRLNIPRPGPPVYITADKDLNAGSLNLGLGGFFRSWNGVYLNRRILYHLTAPEVQDIIGHELGHYYRYYLITQRFHGLTMVVGALSALFVTQWLGLSNVIGLFALAICGWRCWVVSDWLMARNAMAIEYLCDDLGAHVHGVATSINGLLKLGVEQEMQLAIHQQLLSTRDKADLSAKEVFDAIEAAIPYGHISREDLEREVKASLKQRSQNRQTPSLSGFLTYVWQSDTDESEVDEMVQKIQQVQTAPRLNWESLLDHPGEIALNEPQIDQLIEMMLVNSDHLLFRCPEETGDGDGIHPPIWARILYLVRNRQEIEASSR